MRQAIRNNTTLRRLFYRSRLWRSRGQSDEVRIIAELSRCSPRTFVEFGFHPIEFNCIALARNAEWRGLLVDGNARQIADARALYPARIEIVDRFLTLDNLGFIGSAFPQLGVLSIDVDGNDYWFLDQLININPSVICVEYNSSLGLEPITVPYEATFDRHQKHPRGWYHGASLTALSKLCGRHGYGLAAVSAAGTNAFFTRHGSLDPKTSWKANTFREAFSGIGHDQQWETVRSLPFVTV